MNSSECGNVATAICNLKKLSDTVMSLQDKVIRAYVRAEGGQLATLDEVCKRMNGDIASLLRFSEELGEVSPSVP